MSDAFFLQYTFSLMVQKCNKTIYPIFLRQQSCRKDPLKAKGRRTNMLKEKLMRVWVIASGEERRANTLKCDHCSIHLTNDVLSTLGSLKYICISKAASPSFHGYTLGGDVPPLIRAPFELINWGGQTRWEITIAKKTAQWRMLT